MDNVGFSYYFFNYSSLITKKIYNSEEEQLLRIQKKNKHIYILNIFGIKISIPLIIQLI